MGDGWGSPGRAGRWRWEVGGGVVLVLGSEGAEGAAVRRGVGGACVIRWGAV